MYDVKIALSDMKPGSSKSSVTAGSWFGRTLDRWLIRVGVRWLNPPAWR